MNDQIRFILNGARETVQEVAPTTTLLSYLRRAKRLTGTKEGCAEGDCGACTVAVGELSNGGVHYRAVNACIQFLPMVHGKSVVTVEALSGSDGELQSSPASHRRPSWFAVRLLHAGICDVALYADRQQREPGYARHQRRPGRQFVPLHRLWPADRRPPRALPNNRGRAGTASADSAKSNSSKKSPAMARRRSRQTDRPRICRRRRTNSRASMKKTRKRRWLPARPMSVCGLQSSTSSCRLRSTSARSPTCALSASTAINS